MLTTHGGRCIDGVGRFMAPILRGLQTYTGLQAFLVLGGPIPKFNGEIQTIQYVRFTWLIGKTDAEYGTASQ
jgi:hypothetical protein